MATATKSRDKNPLETTLQEMIQQNAVKAALHLTPPLKDTAELDKFVLESTALEEEIASMTRFSQTFTGAEKVAKRQWDDKLQAQRTAHARLGTRARLLAATLPVFDLAPLRWRDEQGFPRLAVFSTDAERREHAGRFTVAVRMGDINCQQNNAYHGSTTTLSYRAIVTVLAGGPAIDDCYLDLVTLILEKFPVAELRKASSSRDRTDVTVTISAEFDQVIPLWLKQRITALKPAFQEVYVVAEVKDWKVSTETIVQPARPENDDPLVIGWDGKEYRLIGAFDATTVEAAAADYLKRS